MTSCACTHTKIDVHDWVTYLNWTPIFRLYVIRRGSYNEYQKGVSSKEIGLCTHNMMTILGSIVNIGETYMTI